MGCKVVAMDISEKALNNLEGSSDLLKLVCDVTSEDDVESKVDEAMERFGRIDLLWNNAGYQGQVGVPVGSSRVTGCRTEGKTGALSN